MTTYDFVSRIRSCIAEEESVVETERKKALAWAAGQLSWERRLRELEVDALADPDESATGLD